MRLRRILLTRAAVAACLIAVIMAWTVPAVGKTLVYAEYFFDTDPGQGHGTQISSPSDGAFDEAQEEFSITLPVALSDGRHKLVLRLKDSDNKWGQRELWFYAVSSSPYAAKTITAAEYYIDTDPGQGSGNPLPAVDGQLDENLELLLATGIDSRSLAIGSHTLYARVKDSYSVWSVPRQFKFGVIEASPYKHLVAAEYFIDEPDPGVGAAIALLAQDGAFDSSQEVGSRMGVATSGLSPGPHTVSVRFKDNWSYWPQFDGWGPVASKMLWVKGGFSIQGVWDSVCEGETTYQIGEIISLRLDSLGAEIMRDTTDINGFFAFDGLIDTSYYLVLPQWGLSGLVIYSIQRLAGDSTGLNIRQDCDGLPTDVQETATVLVPREYSLSQNFPNPFNPTTTIQFALPEPAFVRVAVFNILGEKVAVLVEERLEAGEYMLQWNGADSRQRAVASGIYFYRFTADNWAQTRKMVLLR